VAYAKTNYTLTGAVEFRRGDAQNLDFLPDNSVDFVADFETIAHLAEPSAYLREICRVLRPAGRVMLSAPHLWVDENGNDPNPYYLHDYSHERLLGEIGSVFILERAFVQCAGDGRPTGFRRVWREIDSESPLSRPAEWAICLAMSPSSAPLREELPQLQAYPEMESEHQSYEDRLQGCALRLYGQKVYFWGCGQLYELRKGLFSACRPQCILLDVNPEGITEKDDLAVRHPDDVLPKGEKLPIVIFAWYPEAILRAIENRYPGYTADDIICCVPPAW
jgi:SAM-dependent methyltransferase